MPDTKPVTWFVVGNFLVRPAYQLHRGRIDARSQLRELPTPQAAWFFLRQTVQWHHNVVITLRMEEFALTVIEIQITRCIIFHSCIAQNTTDWKTIILTAQCYLKLNTKMTTYFSKVEPTWWPHSDVAVFSFVPITGNLCAPNEYLAVQTWCFLSNWFYDVMNL